MKKSYANGFTPTPGPCRIRVSDTLQKVVRDTAPELLSDREAMEILHAYVAACPPAGLRMTEKKLKDYLTHRIRKEDALLLLDMVEGMKMMMSTFGFETLDQLDSLVQAQKAQFAEDFFTNDTAMKSTKK